MSEHPRRTWQHDASDRMTELIALLKANRDDCTQMKQLTEERREEEEASEVQETSRRQELHEQLHQLVAQPEGQSQMSPKGIATVTYCANHTWTILHVFRVSMFKFFIITI